ncbi:MAG: VanZ family protein [Patescibacteria group bacterium]
MSIIKIHLPFLKENSVLKINKMLNKLQRKIAPKKQPPWIVSGLLPPLIWAVFIFVLSSQEVLPGFETSLSDFIFKKSAHMFVYDVLYFLTYRSLHLLFTQKRRAVPNKLWLTVLILCLIYAISDELHQSFVSGRHASFRDVGYDMLGGSIALLRKADYI